MKKQTSISDQIWQFFCSVRLTVYTLVLLAATSVIGTVILQNAPHAEYVKRYGQGWTNLIMTFNFDDMYHASWFLLLILILCINIVVCSIDRLSITWKIIFPKQVSVKKERFRQHKSSEAFTMKEPGQALTDRYQNILSKSVGRVIIEKTDKSTVLYSEKGRWTRIGVYIVHSSILFMLVGALIGAIFGFKASMRLDEGKTSDTAFLSNDRSPVKMGFAIRCDDFDVKFYDTGQPADFVSRLTVVENGRDSFTKDVRVNTPLRYKGINIFQSNYGSIGMDKSAVLDVVEHSSKKTILSQKFEIGSAVELPGNQGTFMLEKIDPHFKFMGATLGPAFVGRYTNQNGEEIKINLPVKHAKFDKMRKGNLAFIVKEVGQKYYTGLQVTKDPGVIYVYIGFVLMIIGCWITFFMAHHSYFIEVESVSDKESRVLLSATTNRNNQAMKFNIQRMLTKLKG